MLCIVTNVRDVNYNFCKCNNRNESKCQLSICMTDVLKLIFACLFLKILRHWGSVYSLLVEPATIYSSLAQGQSKPNNLCSSIPNLRELLLPIHKPIYWSVTSQVTDLEHILHIECTYSKFEVIVILWKIIANKESVFFSTLLENVVYSCDGKVKC